MHQGIGQITVRDSLFFNNTAGSNNVEAGETLFFFFFCAGVFNGTATSHFPPSGVRTSSLSSRFSTAQSCTQAVVWIQRRGFSTICQLKWCIFCACQGHVASLGLSLNNAVYSAGYPNSTQTNE